MNTTHTKTERLHSLDSLRAIMMMLGLVIHSAITYGVVDYGSAWSLKDLNATHWTNDYIVWYIHAFRMQIFFFVAGFFGSMIFYERTPKRMIQNRLQRVVYPFLVFVLLLWPTIVFSFSFTGMTFAGDADALSKATGYLANWSSYLPNNTFHLWFLYYLVLLTFTTVLLALLLKKLPAVTHKVNELHHIIIRHPILRVLFFAAVTALMYLFMGTSQVATSGGWVPDLNTFVYYIVFYVAGWILFKSKHHLADMMRMDWLCTIAGTILFSITYFWVDSLGFVTAILVKSVMVWCLIYGITGLFIRYGSGHSPVMRYVSDASYWVFLIHLSFTAIIPGLIADWALPGTVKFLIVMISSTVICFVTYHYFVRTTFIGQFLNGRKYTRKISDIATNQAATVDEPKAS